MGGTLVQLNVSCVSMLGIAQYIPYRQLISISIRYGIQNLYIYIPRVLLAFSNSNIDDEQTTMVYFSVPHTHTL